MELIVDKDKQVTLETLFEELKATYSPQDYTVFKFGIAKGRSIIVGKTFSIGVRVFLKGNVIHVVPQFGSKYAPWLGAGLMFVIMINQKEKKILEKDVFDFLAAKYA